MIAKTVAQAFCITVVPNGNGTRDVFIRQVEPCEARSHMTLDEIEDFIRLDSAYSAAEKARLASQVQEIRLRL